MVLTCNPEIKSTYIILTQVLAVWEMLLRLHPLLISSPYMQTDGFPMQQA